MVGAGRTGDIKRRGGRGKTVAGIASATGDSEPTARKSMREADF